MRGMRYCLCYMARVGMLCGVFFLSAAFSDVAYAETADFVWDSDGIDSGEAYVMVLRTGESRTDKSCIVATDKYEEIHLRRNGSKDIISGLKIKSGADWIFTWTGNGYTIQSNMPGHEKYLTMVKSGLKWKLALSENPVLFQYDGYRLWCQEGDGQNKSFCALDLVMGDYTEQVIQCSSGTYTGQQLWLYRQAKNGEGEFNPRGWYQNNKGIWYYYDDDGKYLEGFHEIDGQTYYFNRGTGIMMDSCAKIIDGITYLFDDTGKCTGSGVSNLPFPGCISGYLFNDDPYKWMDSVRAAYRKTPFERDERLYAAAQQAYEEYKATGTMDDGRVQALAASNGASYGVMTCINRGFPYTEDYLFEPGFADIITDGKYQSMGYYLENGICFMILAGN